MTLEAFLFSVITAGIVNQAHLLDIITESIEVEKAVCHRVYDKTSPR